MYSMRLIKPLKHQVTPPSWNYEQNEWGILPLGSNIPTGDNETTSDPNLRTAPTLAFTTPPKFVQSIIINNIMVAPAQTSTTASDILYATPENIHVYLYQEDEPHISPEFDQEGEKETNLDSKIIDYSPQRFQSPAMLSSGPSSATCSKTKIINQLQPP